ncbi:MAG: hypothetical protein KBT33_03125 [Prevotellaceae bacterium]|nr:hypothetical protein [Candidatus Minthosoma equi]
MEIFIVIAAIIAVWVWWKMTHYNDSDWVKNRIKGRNDDQVAVIRYFCNESACLSKQPISDQEYDSMIASFLSKTDYKQKAINKIGLDESEISEIEPVHFEGFVYDKQSLYKKGDDGRDRSSKYQVTWIFFSATEVYLYQNTFNMDEDGKRERTEEYFYKDITNFSTISETEEVAAYDPIQAKGVLINKDTTKFSLVVPGEKLFCSLQQNEYTENSVKGMKAMLREKKNA